MIRITGVVCGAQLIVVGLAGLASLTGSGGRLSNGEIGAIVGGAAQPYRICKRKCWESCWIDLAPCEDDDACERPGVPCPVIPYSKIAGLLETCEQEKGSAPECGEYLRFGDAHCFTQDLCRCDELSPGDYICVTTARTNYHVVDLPLDDVHCNSRPPWAASNATDCLEE